VFVDEVPYPQTSPIRSTSSPARLAARPRLFFGCNQNNPPARAAGSARHREDGPRCARPRCGGGDGTVRGVQRSVGSARGARSDNVGGRLHSLSEDRRVAPILGWASPSVHPFAPIAFAARGPVLRQSTARRWTRRHARWDDAELHGKGYVLRCSPPRCWTVEGARAARRAPSSPAGQLSAGVATRRRRATLHALAQAAHGILVGAWPCKTMIGGRVRHRGAARAHATALSWPRSGSGCCGERTRVVQSQRRADHDTGPVERGHEA